MSDNAKPAVPTTSVPVPTPTVATPTTSTNAPTPGVTIQDAIAHLNNLKAEALKHEGKPEVNPHFFVVRELKPWLDRLTDPDPEQPVTKEELVKVLGIKAPADYRPPRIGFVK